MGRIIQHETIIVDRIPERIQQLVDNKKNRMAEMQRKCEEFYKSNLQSKQLNAEKSSC